MAIEFDTDEAPEPDDETRREMGEWSAAESNAPPAMLAEQRAFDQRAGARQ